MSDKLEKKKRPDRYCSVCFGYGFAILKSKQTLDGKPVEVHCENCGGSGWTT